MSIKKFGSILVVALALSAVVAASASATVSTTAVQWYTGATEAGVTTLAEKTDTPVTTRLPAGGAATLTGTLNGQAYELKTEEIECLSCNITNEKVTSNTTTPVAIGKGQIKFKNVKVLTPANCTVGGIAAGEVEEAAGTVTTRPLTVHADFMDTTTTNKHDFLNFFPTTGTVFAGLNFVGTKCPIAGKFNVTGQLYGESELNTGVMATEQPVVFNSTVQETTGSTLKLGPTNTTTLTGTSIFETDKTGEAKTFFGVK
jgi:hypothetical protein